MNPWMQKVVDAAEAERHRQVRDTSSDDYDYAAFVRAILTAAREPSEGMCVAAWDSPDLNPKAWLAAMIDAGMADDA